MSSSSEQGSRKNKVLGAPKKERAKKITSPSNPQDRSVESKVIAASQKGKTAARMKAADDEGRYMNQLEKMAASGKYKSGDLVWAPPGDMTNAEAARGQERVSAKKRSSKVLGKKGS